MRARRGETKHERAERKLGEDYPKSRGVDPWEKARFLASKYIPGGKFRKNVTLDNR